MKFPTLTLGIILTLGLALSMLTSCSTTRSEVPTHTAITTDQLETYTCGDISRLHTFGGIFLASQPSAADFAQAKQAGVRTVINLRHAAENKAFDERQVVEDLELNYLSLPFGSPKELNDSILDQARDMLNTADRPILLHCSSANRVGAVWLPWRVLDGGLSFELALAEAKIVGLKSPALEAKARDYIKRRR